MLKSSVRSTNPARTSFSAPAYLAEAAPTASSSRATMTAVAEMPKDTSSSSGKIFAKPSKEYVLPERAKPGRKISVEVPESKRQNQNRISQRAHRARRTDYVQTLEERLRQFEADEIHSNVRLQEVARALKVDNDRLRQDNSTIRSRLEENSNDAEIWAKERKSLLEAVSQLQKDFRALRPGQVEVACATTSSNNEPLITAPHLDLIHRFSLSAADTPPKMSLPPSRPTIDCPICPDPDPDCPCQQPLSDLPPASSVVPTFPTREASQLEVLTLAAQSISESSPPSCGFCQSVEECLCRAVGAEPSRLAVVKEHSPLASEDCGLCTTAGFCACRQDSESSVLPSNTATTSTSTPSIPLRIRQRSQHSKVPVWQIHPPESSPNLLPTCSGDPANCEACKDDSFGREFCTRLFSQPSTTTQLRPCGTCPGNCMSIRSLLVDPYKRPRSGAVNAESMTPDKAWKTLKAHPNARSASLSMLADVVARGSLCVGPAHDPAPILVRLDGTDTGAHDQPSPATGVRTLHVGTSAVRDALRILDGTPPPSSTQVPLDEQEKRGKRRKVHVEDPTVDG